ncbi:MAG TPA: hypothetical protein VGK16_14615 [Candidatus Limnocylindrales bacterium]
MTPPPRDPAATASAQLDVPLAPVGPRGNGRPRAPVAGAALLLVAVVTGVVLAQAFPASPVAPIVRQPSTAVATTVPASSPTPPLALPARLKASELVADVLDGSLDEWLVYADAALQASCGPVGAQGCPADALTVHGLGLDVIPNPGSPADAVAPAGTLLVLRVRGRQLEYLGSLVTHRVAPSIATLNDEVSAQAVGALAPTLRDAGGWLIVHPACFFAASPAPPCDTAPFLAEDQPLPDGTRRSDAGATVALAPDIWGVDPLRDTVSPGPFLVRQVADSPSSWEVVARYEPTKSVRVVIP